MSRFSEYQQAVRRADRCLKDNHGFTQEELTVKYTEAIDVLRAFVKLGCEYRPTRSNVNPFINKKVG